MKEYQSTSYTRPKLGIIGSFFAAGGQVALIVIVTLLTVSLIVC